MWNYRVVRIRHIYTDPVFKIERLEYTYAIHEAYYDDNGYVEAITQNPMEPFKENIEELRHCWVMMADAFRKPILDYDNIPEPGCERKEDPISYEIDESERISEEQAIRNYEKNWGPIDEEAYMKKVEAERLEKEQQHTETYIGIQSLRELINKVFTDYRMKNKKP